MNCGVSSYAPLMASKEGRGWIAGGINQITEYIKQAMLIVEFLVNVAAVYAAAGLIFAAVFVFAGVGRIDPAAKGAPLGFRLLIIPGAVALWPWLLKRWIGAQQPSVESNAHRLRAKERRR